MRVRNGKLIPSTAAEALADCIASEQYFWMFRQSASRTFGKASALDRSRADYLIHYSKALLRNLPARGYKIVRTKP